MPATAEKYDLDFEDTITITSQPRSTRRGAASRTSSPERWNQMQSLVEHFGEAAVAEPAARPRPARRVVTPEATPIEKVAVRPRRSVRHRPFQLTMPATIMWCTVSGLLILLLGLHGATLALSRQNMDIAHKIQLSQEAIDNSNKSISAVQVSPQTAQWALSHGWHIAAAADFDEVPASSSSSTETAAQ